MYTINVYFNHVKRDRKEVMTLDLRGIKIEKPKRIVLVEIEINLIVLKIKFQLQR